MTTHRAVELSQDTDPKRQERAASSLSKKNDTMLTAAKSTSNEDAARITLLSVGWAFRKEYRPEFPDRFGCIQDSRAFLSAVLPLVQPGAPPLRNRVAHSCHGSLRGGSGRSGPTATGARCRLPCPSEPLRSPTAQAFAVARGGLDQQAASGRKDKGRSSVNSHAGCLKMLDARRPSSPLSMSLK